MMTQKHYVVPKAEKVFWADGTDAGVTTNEWRFVPDATPGAYVCAKARVEKGKPGALICAEKIVAVEQEPQVPLGGLEGLGGGLSR